MISAAVLQVFLLRKPCSTAAAAAAARLTGRSCSPLVWHFGYHFILKPSRHLPILLLLLLMMMMMMMMMILLLLLLLG
jgi:hypothetical protein